MRMSCGRADSGGLAIVFGMGENALFGRLDEIISLLKEAGKSPSNIKGIGRIGDRSRDFRNSFGC